VRDNPSKTTCLVTGGTGFVGSHIVQRCVQEGFRVRVLVRPTSDTSLMDQLGVECVVGDLADAETVRRAVDGAELIFHCAAKVGDWGSVREFHAVNVEALGGLLEAAGNVPLKRFVHISSLGVYANGHHYGTDETVVPTRGTDGYANTKIEAEGLVLAAHRERGLPVAVVRPGFIYGPRDRNVLPRLLEALSIQRLMYIGDGNQAVNSIYVGNLVHAIFLMVDRPEAVGQVYNISDDQGLTKRRFIGTVAELAGYRIPQRHVPLWLAEITSACMEGVYRLARLKVPPVLNRARVKFVGYNLDFSVEKARRELGYVPRYDFREGLKTSIDWFRAQGKLPYHPNRGRRMRGNGHRAPRRPVMS